jgi:hypothetical protein
VTVAREFRAAAAVWPLRKQEPARGISTSRPEPPDQISELCSIAGEDQSGFPAQKRLNPPIAAITPAADGLSCASPRTCKDIQR